MIGRAMSIGMAKPMPVESVAIGGVDADDARRRRRASGPPELPGLIAASVWMQVRRAAGPLSTAMSRPLAETMPLVTEFE